MNEVKLVEFLNFGDLPGMLLDHIVKLADKRFHRRYELNQTLRDNHSSKIPSEFGALRNHVAYIAYDIVERHPLRLHLFGDNTDVGLCLECAFKGDVRCRAPHKLYEVIILLG